MSLKSCRFAKALCAAALALAVGCLAVSEPACPTPAVILLGAESGRGYALSESCESPSVLPINLPRVLDAFALASDTTVLFFTGFDPPDQTRFLFALEPRSQRLLWRRSLSEIATAGPIEDLTLVGNYALAVSYDRSRLILNGTRHGVPGLAALSLETLEPVAFHGPLVVPREGAAALVPTVAIPGGAIAAAGTRDTAGRPTRGIMLLLDADLTPLDSIVLVPAFDDRWGGMRQVTTSPDGRRVYASSVDSILAYDVSARNVAARARRPSQGWLAVAPLGNRVYVTDPGDGRDSPGTGLVFVFDATLRIHDPIDLRDTLDGTPPVTNRAFPAATGPTLYVTSGTSSRGPLYGPQPARVFVVNVVTGALTRLIPLNDWGALEAFPTHE